MRNGTRALAILGLWRLFPVRSYQRLFFVQALRPLCQTPEGAGLERSALPEPDGGQRHGDSDRRSQPALYAAGILCPVSSCHAGRLGGTAGGVHHPLLPGDVCVCFSGLLCAVFQRLWPLRPVRCGDSAGPAPDIRRAVAAAAPPPAPGTGDAFPAAVEAGAGAGSYASVRSDRRGAADLPEIRLRGGGRCGHEPGRGSAALHPADFSGTAAGDPNPGGARAAGAVKPPGRPAGGLLPGPAATGRPRCGPCATICATT